MLLSTQFLSSVLCLKWRLFVFQFHVVFSFCSSNLEKLSIVSSVASTILLLYICKTAYDFFVPYMQQTFSVASLTDTLNNLTKYIRQKLSATLTLDTPARSLNARAQQRHMLFVYFLFRHLDVIQIFYIIKLLCICRGGCLFTKT